MNLFPCLPKVRRCCFALILLIATTARSVTDPLSQWHFSHPKPVGNDLLAVTFGNGLFVAGGTIGTIITSIDGTNWVRQQTPITATLRAVEYANSRFVAVGDLSAIISSVDGTNWAAATVTGTQSYGFTGVAWGNGMWVAANAGGYKVTSVDGIHWNVSTNRTMAFSDITFGAGKFVAVDGTFAYVSSDGTNWVPGFYPNGERITFGRGLYISSSDPSVFSVSTNGFAWSGMSTGFDLHWLLRQMTFDGARFWMVARDVLSSADGTNWVLASSGLPTAAMAAGNNTMVLVGDHGLILTSNNASNWVNQSSITYDAVTNLCYANGRFIATLSPGKFLVSSNGSRWDLLSTDLTNQIRKLIWTGDSSSAQGAYVGAAGGGIVVSGSDITNLVARDTGAGASLNSVAFGGSSALAVGDRGNIVRSTDLSTWSAVFSGTTNSLVGIIYGGGRFVSVGTAGTILQSADGVTFSPDISGTTLDFVDIACGCGRFIAIEQRGFVDVSTNGLDWQRVKVSTSPWTCIGYGAGRFVLGSSSGTMRGSVDGGLSWTRFDSGNSVPMRSVVFGDGTFVAGGDNGAILQSDPIVLLQIAESTDTIITVSGPRERDYQIEWSDRLPAVTWNLLGTNTPVEEKFTIHDSPTLPARFYRVRLGADGQ
jgi:hypothetical protein